VIQHVISKGEPDDRRRVVSIVMQQLMHFSKHKFASNVVEKSLEYADEDQQTRMFMILIQPDATGQSPVFGLLRDQYGNYVIRMCSVISFADSHS
jgi:mRNA-binding protein PUF3